jgi:hypothetical protein
VDGELVSIVFSANTCQPAGWFRPYGAFNATKNRKNRHLFFIFQIPSPKSQVPIFVQLLTATSQQPPASNHQPATTSQQPIASNQQPATNSISSDLYLLFPELPSLL